ncbi:sulfatase-like hydrolase/transferase [Novosphingobium sp. TH158]|uniref:sulfatase-like hydrolase/transferase n=1 Tax=Novosphingobium sp. TH158 TaxID=2067455 RepID=UPI000C7E5543|nr:sulfatase-like hydrolase/transferase [Novosphingobium sp. TH158]PLK27596.1 hypothetical protein C0V78_12415 [Novosphingobium sp. TH158]
MMMLDKRLADDIIRYLRNQNAAAPGKRFMLYWAPGSTHAPHQAPADYIARFKGRFDQGWDKLREETFKRQLAAGIVPKGTKLTPRPAEIPLWDSLTAGQKAFAARAMEVAAAPMAYQDEQIGRVLAELDRMGLSSNTLVSIIQGDNGASGEAGPPGTINELRSISTHDENEAWMEANTDKLGGPETYRNSPVGWAWAMNTPLRWVKQMPSMLGGVRNGMILNWPGHVAHPGAVCSQFGHLVDIARTVLDAAKLPAPDSVYSVKQKPLDGQSLLGSLAACDGAKPRTQYFEIGGKVGLYLDGWFLSGDDGRPSWIEQTKPRPLTWTLYNLDKDFAQGTDLAAKEPARLSEMLALWKAEAARNNVFPLDKPDASGAVLAWGSKFGGLGLYLDHGHAAFAWAKSTDPAEMATVRSATTLPQGKVNLTLRFEIKGGTAIAILSSNGVELARGPLPSIAFQPSGNGESLDICRDLGVGVTAYATPFGEIKGDVPHVSIDFD